MSGSPQTTQPKTLADIISKLDVSLARHGVFFQEMAEKINDDRNLLMVILQNYEQIITEQNAKIKKLEDERASAAIDPVPINT